MRSKLKQIGRIYHTARHLTLKQWIFRGFHFAKKRFYRRLGFNCAFVQQTTLIPFYYKKIDCLTNKEDIVQRAEDILRNEFEFIKMGGQRVIFEKQIDWTMPENSYRLLCFNLNYFDFLLDLADAFYLTQDKKYIQKGFSLIEDWRRQWGNTYDSNVWDAFVVAKRIQNWIGFISVFGQYAEQISEIQNSICAQSRFLSKNIEYHLGANHLVMEAKALAFAGVYLKDQKMYQWAILIMNKEYKEQFLQDGGHYERSISYHIETLQHYFEVGMLQFEVGIGDSRSWIRNLYLQFLFLHDAVMPNGEIPLVNDSSEDYPMHVSEMLSCANRLYQSARFNQSTGCYGVRWISDQWRRIPMDDVQKIVAMYSDTGYLFLHNKIEQQHHYLLFDIGNNGPDYNLGHTHADALNILWTINQAPVLTDSGVFTYQPGEDRDYYRSTAAHNTIEIDGKSSSDIWSAFRVAKRAYTKINAFHENAQFVFCSAVHDGYSTNLKQGSLLHERNLFYGKEGGWFVIIDRVYGQTQMNCEAVCRFHIAPCCPAEKESGHTVLLNHTYRLQCKSQIEMSQSKYSKKFGEYKYRTCIEERCSFSHQMVFINIFSSLKDDVNVQRIDEIEYAVDYNGQSWLIDLKNYKIEQGEIGKHD